MKYSEDLLTKPINVLKRSYPFIEKYFVTNGLELEQYSDRKTMAEFIAGLNPIFLDDLGVTKEELAQRFLLFLDRMEEIKKGIPFKISSITICGGQDKGGVPENNELIIRAGDIVSIVGPTGAGKSRLLADIDWMAQRDTPTKRQILINGEPPRNEWRFSMEYKLVAQLSQNMNYVMDLSVKDFIRVHAECRLIDDINEKVEYIIEGANELSGEQFSPDTPLTSLSGGQSRALMVADTAYLSTSPIVLIDEIENAGIHRERALDLLVGNDKIVLIVTHDPLLALMGDRRIVIKNGGIFKVLETSLNERMEMEKLKNMDQFQQKYRELLRNGEEICAEVLQY